ncbi:MAG TPA: hypothetical protein VN873_17920 [Candidatus Angelobacter sp.]|nr:hypothetical protein [Candidatus Angelobacter sp.]
MISRRACKFIIVSGTTLILFLMVISRGGAREPTDGPPPKSRQSPVFTVEVESENGRPLPNVTVVWVDDSTNAVLNGTTIERGSGRLQTDSGGKFTFRQHRWIRFSWSPRKRALA